MSEQYRRHLTAADLDRVFFQAENAKGQHVNVSAKDATAQQFHKWATGRTLVEGENGEWTPEDRAEFCDVLYQHDRIHLYEKEVSRESANA